MHCFLGTEQKKNKNDTNTLDTLTRFTPVTRFSTATWRYKYILASTVIFLKGV